MLDHSPCRYIPGHGVASGMSKDPRFPGGTLAMQSPFFQTAGLDLSDFHPGTLNLLLLGRLIKLLNPKHSFSKVKWSANYPAENFSFFPCELKIPMSEPSFPALLYWPHPSTKPEFHQPEGSYEFLAPFIDGLNHGDIIHLRPTHNSFRLITL